MLLKAAVVIQLIPFIYLFLALVKADGVSAGARVAGVVGLVTTAIGLCAAFLPTADVTSVALFETKMVVGVVGPTAVGWFLFKRGAAAADGSGRWGRRGRSGEHRDLERSALRVRTTDERKQAKEETTGHGT